MNNLKKLFNLLDVCWEDKMQSLGVVKDFLLDHEETEKANCLQYLIDNKKQPFLFMERFSFYISVLPLEYNLLPNYFCSMNDRYEIYSRSFSGLIYKTFICW